MTKGHDRKRKNCVTVEGKWLPMALTFLNSRACAELSPHGAKLMLDLLAKLGANGYGNGDLSLAPGDMRVRGWTSRQTLGDAVRELTEHGLLVQTHQGSRLDCSLFALTLFPLQCDLKKLDVGPGCYTHLDYEKAGRNPPHKSDPAKWRRARKTLLDTPPRDEVGSNRPVAGQSAVGDRIEIGTSSRHGTKPPIFVGSTVPPRVTFIDYQSDVGSSAVRMPASWTLIGRILHRARPATRPAGYAVARSRFHIEGAAHA